jgi:hypothetical protein
LAEVIYIDRYGNAVTGLRAASVGASARLKVAERRLRRCRTFADAATGEAFYYANSNGLIEIAMPGASAAEALDLARGSGIALM